MKANDLLFLALIVAVLNCQHSAAAEEITRWDLNQGGYEPAIGNGELRCIGGVLSDLSHDGRTAGEIEAGKALRLYNFPLQNNGNGTAGVIFMVDVQGYEDISFRFDHYFGLNSADKHLIQYTVDGGETWINSGATVNSFNPSWVGRDINKASDARVNDNPDFGFRIIAMFNSSEGYSPVGGGRYDPSAVWAFDNVVVTGDPVRLPTLPVPVALRSSLSYAIIDESFDVGGGVSTNSNAQLYASLAVGGLCNVPSASSAMDSKHLKQGFIAGIYEIERLSIHSTPEQVMAGGSSRIEAEFVADDQTTVCIGDVAPEWEIVDGPIREIRDNGELIAADVYTNTIAVIKATAIFKAGLELQVVDSDYDNFGVYAGDGLPDYWQHYYFGLDGGQAMPQMDPDNDGRNNRIECITGFSPIDDTEKFVFKVFLDQADLPSLILNKAIPGRRYSIESSDTLSGPWSTVVSLVPVSETHDFVVNDLDTGRAMRFFRLRMEWWDSDSN
ncbi:MAG: hypothetical protein K9N48_08545 [Verrucomicrobia bacterium]|nr:hypothetical protein [Verrucomicrobiota bacterium]MCF7707274.1 hypothetical protein [Verrucomicrobiota bacterium]